jgi:hypothetical protein
MIIIWPVGGNAIIGIDSTTFRYLIMKSLGSSPIVRIFSGISEVRAFHCAIAIDRPMSSASPISRSSTSSPPSEIPWSARSSSKLSAWVFLSSWSYKSVRKKLH